MSLVEHSHTAGSIAESHYQVMRNSIAEYLAGFTASASATPIFETNVDTGLLWAAYLQSFPLEERQHHNCSCCRHFIQRFGHLVAVNPNGTLRSVTWPSLPGSNPYSHGLAAMRRIVEAARIERPFYSKERTYGTPVTGGEVEWTHMYARPHASFIHTNRIKAPHQLAADKVQNFTIVRRALSEWPLVKLTEAKLLLETGGLAGAHNVLPGLTWLLNLATERDGGANDNQLWADVVKASDAFCHPRSGAIGSLMDDLMSGMDVQSVKNRFAAVMNPYTYQRSSHTITAGAVNQAEKLLAASGCAASLSRRVAKLDEVELIWTPSGSPGTTQAQPAAQVEAPRIFGHLLPADAGVSPALGTLRAGSMTWAKFSAQILPSARAIEVLIPRVGNFVSTLTAVDADAPAILQWDHDDGLRGRNPVSQYGYIGGTPAERWGAVPDTFVEVAGLMRNPAHFYGNASHHAESVTFVLPLLRDSKNTGSGLFPQNLKQEFHSIRAVIEAHSNKTPVEQLPAGEASANGIRLESTGTDTALIVTLRVTLPTGNTVLYRIDRWD